MEKEASQRIWQNVQDELNKKLNKGMFEILLSMLKFKTIEGNRAYFATSGEYGKEHVEKNYKVLLQGVFSSLLNQGDFEVIFLISPEEFRGTDSSKTPGKQGPQLELFPEESCVEPLNSESKENAEGDMSDEYSEDRSHYTFDNFIIGNSNELAANASICVAKEPGKSFNPLFIYGPSGTGKTHLLNAICCEVANKFKNKKKIKLLTANDFTREYVSALADHTITQFSRKYRRLDILLIDDIHFLVDREKTQEEFFHIFNDLFNRRKQIVIVSDREPQEIKGLQNRLITRFSSGLVVDIKPPNLETRLAILEKKVKNHNVTIPFNVLQLIAENFHSSVRSLEGALMKVIAEASFKKEKITIERAEKILHQLIIAEKSTEKKQFTLDEIQAKVAEYYEFRVSDFKGKKRTAALALARQVAMYFCRQLTQESTPVIANAFERNHSTVLHAVETVIKKMEKDKNFEHEISMLTNKFQNN